LDGGNFSKNDYLFNLYGSIQGARSFGERFVYKAGV
jgi:hypothetical protein